MVKVRVPTDKPEIASLTSYLTTERLTQNWNDDVPPSHPSPEISLFDSSFLPSFSHFPVGIPMEKYALSSKQLERTQQICVLLWYTPKIAYYRNEQCVTSLSYSSQSIIDQVGEFEELSSAKKTLKRGENGKK